MSEDRSQIAYRVRDWESNFETSESRKRRGPLGWVALPTKQDGRGYRRVQRHQRACELFAAWILILEVAAKMPTRGLLVDDEGPLDAEDLADKTGYPAEIFDLAFDVLKQPRIGWVEAMEWGAESSAGDGSDGMPPASEQAADAAPNQPAEEASPDKSAESSADISRRQQSSAGCMPTGQDRTGQDRTIPTHPRASSSDDAWRQCVTSIQRLAGQKMSVSQQNQLQSSVIQPIGDSIQIRGEPVSTCWLVHLAACDAIDQGNAPNSPRAAFDLTKAIVNRCLRDDCWPGEYAEKSTGKPVESSKDRWTRIQQKGLA